MKQSFIKASFNLAKILKVFLNKKVFQKVQGPIFNK
jgi:hypothetical protein